MIVTLFRFPLLFMLATLAAQDSLLDDLSGSVSNFNMNNFAEYFELAKLYWGSDGGRATECLASSFMNGWKFNDSADFLTVGLEGAGHHLIMGLPEEIPGFHGGRYSYSGCGTCKRKPDVAWRRFPSATALNRPIFNDPLLKDFKKFLVLIRDPVDSWSSALRRFWRANDPGEFKGDTLQKERDELLHSIQIMSDQIDLIPCERVLFLSYELLIHYPDKHLAVMAHFLNVSEKNRALLTWFESLKREEVSYRQKNGFSTKEHYGEVFAGPYEVECETTLGEKLESAEWPSDMTKQCTVDCITSFRQQLTSWLYPHIRDKYPATMPQHPMSYCRPHDAQLTEVS